MNFIAPADHRIKIKKKKKKGDEYLDFAKEMRKLWNMMVTVIPIVIGALGSGNRKSRNRNMNRDHINYSTVVIS